MDRRNLLTSLAAGSLFTSLVDMNASTHTQPQENQLTVNPSEWKGPYSEHRKKNKALHDWRLCAQLKGPWPGPSEPLILRTSEVVGYEDGFFYDDHFPPSEPEGRGKDYRHIPFAWKVVIPGRELFADCAVPGKGKFSIRLKAQSDFLDIHLTARNDLRRVMKDLDWAFCAISFESPSISDSEQERTYLFDGEKLRTLGEIRGRNMALYKVAGANGYIPPGHRMLAIGPVEAKASVVIIEGVDGEHSVALGFEQADSIYGDAKGNKCFHADPYFASLKPGEERNLRGRLYLMKGNAEAAFKQFQKDFPDRNA